jgi:hypothetical protein
LETETGMKAATIPRMGLWPIPPGARSEVTNPTRLSRVKPVEFERDGLNLKQLLPELDRKIRQGRHLLADLPQLISQIFQRTSWILINLSWHWFAKTHSLDCAVHPALPHVTSPLHPCFHVDVRSEAHPAGVASFPNDSPRNSKVTSFKRYG